MNNQKNQVDWQNEIQEQYKQLKSMKQIQIFGYGSLIWKPDIEYKEQIQGYLEGYQTQFCQGSADHRGTPDCLGRVCTLIEQRNKKAYGVVFVLADTKARETLDKLAVREKGGYEVLVKQIVCDDGVNRTSLVYVASRDNPLFIKDEQMVVTASVISRAIGTAGTNYEYFINILHALRQRNIYDHYLEQLCHYIHTIRPELTN